MKCPACHFDIDFSTSSNTTYPGKENHSNKPENIFFCPQCEIGFAHPMLTDKELESLYEGGEFWNGEEKLILPKNYPSDYTLAEARWELITENIPNKPEKTISILDIGAGRGCLGLIAAQDSRFLVHYTAMEPDPVFQNALKQTWQSLFSNNNLKTWSKLEDNGEQFDLVALSHVLEHVRDPQDFLKFCSQYLKKEGVLFIDIPNQDHLFKPDVFPHLLFFSKNSLKKLLQLLNFEVLQLDSWGRPRENTPMNTARFNYLHFLEKVIFKTKRFLPETVLELLPKYYNWYYGGNRQHSRGTWIRSLAQKKS